jgi:hypothetical protein
VHEVRARTRADLENGSLGQPHDSLTNFPDRLRISHPANQEGNFRIGHQSSSGTKDFPCLVYYRIVETDNE